MAIRTRISPYLRIRRFIIEGSGFRGSGLNGSCPQITRIIEDLFN
jgi:hypothetical protein